MYPYQLLKVPPASRGNRWAWFPSRSGENLKEGGNCKLCPCDRYDTNRQAKVHKKQQLITPSLRFPLHAGGTKTLRFPSRSGGNLRRGGIVNSALAIGKCLCVGFSTCPPPNLPCGRGRSRDSLPARGEGWGGGYV